jgi:hypothetical protein
MVIDSAELLRLLPHLSDDEKAELDKLLTAGLPRWIEQIGPQMAALDTQADILFYGGQAGGGGGSSGHLGLLGVSFGLHSSINQSAWGLRRIVARFRQVSQWSPLQSKAGNKRQVAKTPRNPLSTIPKKAFPSKDKRDPTCSTQSRAPIP